uniref:Uncharacterized protein n=1 Tax=Arundo donax TaxID=35708 RepID=A0A0A9E3R4_ARUDO
MLLLPFRNGCLVVIGYIGLQVLLYMVLMRMECPSFCTRLLFSINDCHVVDDCIYLHSLASYFYRAFLALTALHFISNA